MSANLLPFITPVNPFFFMLENRVWHRAIPYNAKGHTGREFCLEYYETRQLMRSQSERSGGKRKEAALFPGSPFTATNSF